MNTSPVHLMVLGIIVCCGGCSSGNESTVYPTPVPARTISVSADVACSLAAGGTTQEADYPACASACGNAVYNTCTLPAGYVQAFSAANGPAAPAEPVDAAAGLVDPSPAVACPAVTSPIEVTCERVDF